MIAKLVVLGFELVVWPRQPLGGDGANKYQI